MASQLAVNEQAVEVAPPKQIKPLLST